MAAYVIFCMSEVNDEEALGRYRAAARPSLVEHAPRVLCGPAIATTLEGAPLKGALVLEFASREAAEAWYRSEDYQAAAALRRGAAVMQAFIVDGR